MLDFPGEGVNLRKSAVFCENLRFGLSLSPSLRPLKLALSLTRSYKTSTRSLDLRKVGETTPNGSYPEDVFSTN